MAVIDRRALLREFLPSAAAAASVAVVGLTLMPKVSTAMPIAIAKTSGAKANDAIEKAQVVVVGPRRRGWRRRRVCWWHRGRRVCAWR